MYNNNTNNNNLIVDIILRTLIFITMTELENNKPYPKLKSLRKLLMTLYSYPSDGYDLATFKDELFNMLKGNICIIIDLLY